MDVLRDTAILDLDRNNVEVLQEQLRETRDRFTVGEVTRTDVAQAEASLATRAGDRARAVRRCRRRWPGIGRPSATSRRASRRAAVVRPLPKALPEAISISQVEHPAIVASLPRRQLGATQVKIAEGALYPTVGVTGSIQNTFDLDNTPGLHALVGSLVGQVTIPIYQGGDEYATTRQAKESLGAAGTADRFGT